MDYFVDHLGIFLCLERGSSCGLWEDQRALRFNHKYIKLKGGGGSQENSLRKISFFMVSSSDLKYKLISTNYISGLLQDLFNVFLYEIYFSRHSG